MEEKMVTAMTRFHMSRFMPLCLMTLLTFGLFFMNLREVESLNVTSQALSDTALVTTMGASIGGCGIAVGVAAGAIALAVSGATIGFGSALVISTALHVGAIICAS
jgi:hypothetical protein